LNIAVFIDPGTGLSIYLAVKKKPLNNDEEYKDL